MRDGLQTGELIRDAIEPYEDTILRLQQEQLLSGKRSDGEDIRPYYSEDLKPGGYFKTRDSAARYAAWKTTLSYPYEANRNADAPNLYINGKFHSELGVVFGSDAVTIAGTTPYAAGIVAKYGIDTFGLSEQSWAAVFEMGAFDNLLTNIRNIFEYGSE